MRKKKMQRAIVKAKGPGKVKRGIARRLAGDERSLYKKGVSQRFERRAKKASRSVEELPTTFWDYMVATSPDLVVGPNGAVHMKMKEYLPFIIVPGSSISS